MPLCTLRCGVRPLAHHVELLGVIFSSPLFFILHEAHILRQQPSKVLLCSAMRSPAKLLDEGDRPLSDQAAELEAERKCKEEELTSLHLLEELHAMASWQREHVHSGLKVQHDSVMASTGVRRFWRTGHLAMDATPRAADAEKFASACGVRSSLVRGGATLSTVDSTFAIGKR